MLHRIRSQVAAISAQALLKITLKRASCEIEVRPEEPAARGKPALGQEHGPQLRLEAHSEPGRACPFRGAREADATGLGGTRGRWRRLRCSASFFSAGVGTGLSVQTPLPRVTRGRRPGGQRAPEAWKRGVRAASPEGGAVFAVPGAAG